MRLNINGCQSYCEQNNITNIVDFARLFGLSVKAIKLLIKGRKIGYEAVKDIYNKLGEKTVMQLIDFEEETLNGFKSKYIQLGKRLY